MEQVIFGVVTASDRASSGEYEDVSGLAIADFLYEAISTPLVIKRRIIPDDQATIESTLAELADVGCAVIITTGGTGPAPRDVTPDATEAVCDRMLPGFGEQMRAISLRHVPTAVLSRQTAGTRGRCLILNLPGSMKFGPQCRIVAILSADHTSKPTRVSGQHGDPRMLAVRLKNETPVGGTWPSSKTPIWSYHERMMRCGKLRFNSISHLMHLRVYCTSKERRLSSLAAHARKISRDGSLAMRPKGGLMQNTVYSLDRPILGSNANAGAQRAAPTKSSG